MQVLVTGGSGFVGRNLLTGLVKTGKNVACAARRKVDLSCPVHVVPSLDGKTQWCKVLEGHDAVIHLAARVHVMRESVADPLAAFREVNVEGTLNLARQAARAGVGRFVFLSSVKVCGEETGLGHPFTEDMAHKPDDPYALSKYEAEQGLLALAAETGMEVVIIRPPLVYGPGVKANFLSLLRVLDKGLPLPLGALANRRSLVYLENLVDFIILCLEHPAAANEVFLVSDGEDMSTSELLRRMARALGRPARLIPVPQGLLAAGLAMVGKREIARRLCGSLQVDIGKARQVLSWQPPYSVDYGLRQTARWFLEQKG